MEWNVAFSTLAFCSTMVVPFPFLRYRLGLGPPRRMCSIIGRLLWHPGTWLAALVAIIVRYSGGFCTRSLPEPPGESNDDEMGEVEPSPHATAASSPGKRAADPNDQESRDVGSVKRPRTEEDADEEDFESSEYLVDYTDEFYCEYDSTWEMSENYSQSTDRHRRAHNNYNKFGRFRNAARDLQNFRHDYPKEKTRYKQWKQEDHMPNLDFYLRKRASSPDGIYVDEFHKNWLGAYNKLESVHTFIQWLFPLQEPGVNYQAVELTKKEIKAFLEDDVAKANLIKSYELMLDFYGIKLSNEKTGEVQRAHNWKERFANLNRNTHNNQRITRILKCLGTLGFDHYQAPLVRFFLHETLVNDQLPAVKESVLNYFLFAVLDKRRRRSLIKFAYKNYTPREEFVWCPRKIQAAWSKDAQLPDSSQTTTVAYVDEKAVEKPSDFPEKPLNQSPSECCLSGQDNLTGEREGTREKIQTATSRPINQSPSERSLPGQDDFTAEREETKEKINMATSRPINQSPSERSLPGQDDFTAEREETKEKINMATSRPINQSPSERSLPGQDDFTAEREETKEKIDMATSHPTDQPPSERSLPGQDDLNAEREETKEKIDTATSHPINQSCSDASLLCQEGLTAESQETRESVNPKPINPNSTDESSDTTTGNQMNANQVSSSEEE